MKVICVSKTPLHRLTVGKTYEAIQGSDGRWAAIDDDGDVEYWILEERFRPVPDPVPEPVNEWMPCGELLLNVMGNWVARYINLITGIILTFYKKENGDHVVVIASIHNNKEYLDTENQYADAFAQMVGYKWEE